MHAIYERATMTLSDYRNETGTSTAHVRACFFQMLTALEAGARMMGLAHNDWHDHNVMVRDVRGTPYADKIWAYKRAGNPNYYFIRPEDHRNMLVEIIDLGRGTMLKQEPQGTPEARFMIALHFARDTRYILQWIGGSLGDDTVVNELMRLLPLTYRDTREQPSAYQEQLGAALAENFFQHWPDDTELLGQIFWSMREPPTEKERAQVILMSVVPHGNILNAVTRSNDALLAPSEETLAVQSISTLWRVRQGHKRVLERDFAAPTCATCQTPEGLRWSTPDRTRHFCGQDCWHVYSGVYKSV
jgi:hypothetical protein